MSLEEKEEGPCLPNGAKVSELKKGKKKKRKLVSSDFEENLAGKKRILRSDVAKQREKEAEDAKKKASEEGGSGFEKNGNSYIISKRNGIDGIICDKEMEVEKKRVLRSDVAKKRELANARLKKSTEEAAVKDGHNLSNGIEKKVTEEIAPGTDQNDGSFVTSKDVVKSDVASQMEEADTDKMKVRVVVDSDLKQVVVEVAPKVDQNRDGSATSECNDTEEKKFDEEIKVECKRNRGLDVVEQRERADTDKKEVIEEAASGAGHKDNSIISSRNDINQIKYEKIRVENRRVTRSSAAKLREEADTNIREVEEANSDKKRATEEVSSGVDQNGSNSTISREEGIEIENKIIGSNVCKQREGSDNLKKKITGENIKVGKKRIMRSDVAGQRDEVDTNKNKEKVTKSGLERKKRRQASDADTTRKKIKTESLKCRQDRTEEPGGKKLKTGSSKSRVLGSEPAVLINRQKDGQSDRGTQPNARKGSRLEGEKIKQSKRFGQRTLKMLKDKRSLRPPRVGDQNMPKHHSFSRERRVLKKSSSVLSLGKSQLNMGKTSALEKKISHVAKIEPELLSPSKESKNLYATSGKREVMVKGESKTPLLTKQDKEAERIERMMARQNLRDHIKGMLLSAGWKIDLRPRRGKNYADSVYISPKGHEYWSITKAYDVFQSQFSHEHDDKGKDLSGKPLKKSRKRSFPPFSPIPMEVLSILRHPISKRRTKEQLREAKMKLGDGGKTKKAKKATGIKYPKNKNCKSNGGKLKRRVRKADIAGSNTEGALGSVGKKPHLGKYRKKQKGCALLVRGFNQEAETGTDVYVPYSWKRTIFSWMIDLGIMPENARVKYMNWRHTQTLLEGQITRGGIRCSCCSKILTVSKFEIHAGSKLCQPYQNIFLRGAGTSLLQCQINAWEKQEESERRGFYSIDIHGDDPNDDTCGICGDGGDLICCDGCPSTFHQSCLGFEMLPPGNWHCMNCLCKYCGISSGAVAQENGGIVSPLLSCSQCEEKYHPTCVPGGDSIPVSSDLSSVPFCGQNCRKIFEKLRMLLGVKNYLDAGFSWTLVQRFDEDLSESVCGLDQRAECNAKVAVALAVMDECFLPIIDQRSGINLIHNVVYNCGSNFNRLNYHGFYTFILERDDEIVSVASLRIHGTKLAEMPFIGTRNMYRRQGMCRRLLNEIESALCSLNIEKLVIPAISELMGTWTNVFGFKLLEVAQKQEIRSINLLVFPGTGLLLKPLLKMDLAEQFKTADKVDKFEPESQYHHAPAVANESSVYSSVGPESHASDDVIIQHKHNEVRDVGPSFPISGSCMNSTSEVSLESPDAPHEFEFQGPEYRPLEIATYEDLLLQPEAVSLNGPVTGNKFQKGSSLEPEINLPCDVHDNNGVVLNLLPFDNTLGQHTSEAKCMSPDATASAPRLPDIDCRVGRLHFEAQCTSPDAIASTLRDSGGNTPHISVCSLEYESHNHRSEVTSKSITALRTEHSSQASSKHIVDDNTNVKDQVASLQSNSKAFGENSGHCHSETITGPLDAVANKFLTSSEEPNIHAVGEGIVQDTLELKAEALHVRPGKEIPESEIIPICANSGCDLQISDDRSIYRDSELQEKLPESHNPDLPFTTIKLHHSYGEQKPCAFGETSVEDQASDIVKSVCVASKSSILSSCGVKSSEMPGDSPSSSAVTYDKLKAGNHSFHLLSAVPGVISSCASEEGIVVDTFKNCLIAPGHRSNVVASENHAVECITDLPKYNDTTSGRILSKFSESTSVAVQPNLPTTNVTTVAIPAEPSHTCCEGAHDGNSSEAEFSALKPVHAFGECSSCCSMEVAAKSLVYSTLKSAEVSSIQHKYEFSYRSHTSNSGVTSLSAVGLDTCEINEVISGPSHAHCLVPSHDIAD